MKRSDSLLAPRRIGQGYSLRDAYRPVSSEGLARMLVEHPCRSCGRVASSMGRPWDAGPKSQHVGPLLYCTLSHTCMCGLTMPIFVVLNDLLRTESHPCIPTADAIEQVEDSLPPEDLELGLNETLCLLHRGDQAEAVLLAEALVMRHPDRAECRFNAGCARQRLGDTTEALDHYEQALALHPQLADAWLNRGLLLRQLGRHTEARFCFARRRQVTTADAATPPPPVAHVLEEQQGSFGRLRVIQDEDMRALFIGAQCQGAMFLDERDESRRPSAFAHSPFTTGWLLAGCRHPQGRGLMLGLGSGAGAVTLLTNFPTLQLRVVEVDGTLIDLALRFFPRLARFRREGRLELVHADARDVVAAYDAGEPSPFDFVLLDLFTGAPEAPPLLREPGFIGGVVRCAPTVLTNAIFTLGEQGHIDWLRLFANAGAPIVAQYPTGDPDGWSTRPHNWILSSVAVEPASDFAPFADSTHYIAKALRNDFHCMVDRVVPAPAAVVSAPGCDVVPTASA